MKKTKLNLRIEKTSISRLTNPNLIKGGNETNTADCQFISRFPTLCPPPATASCPPCGTTIWGETIDCP